MWVEIWRYPVKSMAGESLEQADIVPLLVASDGMFSAVGYDRRKFRLNPVIGGVSGLAERRWAGGRLRIGDVVIHREDLRSRCIMTTFDSGTGRKDLSVLRRVQQDFGGALGPNSHVVAPGPVAVGDKMEFMPPS